MFSHPRHDPGVSFLLPSWSQKLCLIAGRRLRLALFAVLCFWFHLLNSTKLTSFARILLFESGRRYPLVVNVALFLDMAFRHLRPRGKLRVEINSHAKCGMWAIDWSFAVSRYEIGSANRIINYSRQTAWVKHIQREDVVFRTEEMNTSPYHGNWNWRMPGMRLPASSVIIQIP